jgi:hypothetical protein
VYSLKKDPLYLKTLPAIVIFNLEGYNKDLASLQDRLEEHSKDFEKLFSEKLAEAIDVIRTEEDAEEAIELFCLDYMFEDSEGGYLNPQAAMMIDCIYQAAIEVHKLFKLHKLYKEGLLLYRGWIIKSSGIYLQRQDLFEKELQDAIRNK